jgi:hypothetical protein
MVYSLWMVYREPFDLGNKLGKNMVGVGQVFVVLLVVFLLFGHLSSFKVFRELLERLGLRGNRPSSTVESNPLRVTPLKTAVKSKGTTLRSKVTKRGSSRCSP